MARAGTGGLGRWLVTEMGLLLFIVLRPFGALVSA